VKNLCHVVGLSCDGFEDQMLALFSAIEASRNQAFAGYVSKVYFKPGTKGNRELQWLDCSINYDKKGGQSNRGKESGGDQIVHSETQDTLMECQLNE